MSDGGPIIPDIMEAHASELEAKLPFIRKSAFLIRTLYAENIKLKERLAAIEALASGGEDT